MTKTGQYTQHIRLQVTPAMHEILQILAARRNMTISDLIREALREYIDAQEDIIGSRTRLGHTVMRELEITRNRILAELQDIKDALLKEKDND